MTAALHARPERPDHGATGNTPLPPPLSEHAVDTLADLWCEILLARLERETPAPAPESR